MEGGIGSQRAFRVPPYLGDGSVGDGAGEGVGDGVVGSAQPLKMPPETIMTTSRTRNRLFIIFYLPLITGLGLIYSKCKLSEWNKSVMITGQLNRID
jgi:hypothetical protein